MGEVRKVINRWNPEGCKTEKGIKGGCHIS